MAEAESRLLRIETSGKARDRVVSLFGELDLLSGDELESTLKRVERSRPSRLVVDLRGLTFTDVAGLRALARAESRARRLGCEFKLVKGSAFIDRVFQLVQANEGFDFLDEP